MNGTGIFDDIIEEAPVSTGVFDDLIAESPQQPPGWETETDGWETETEMERLAREFAAEKAFPTPGPEGFVRRFGKSFAHPFVAAGHGPGVFTLSDDVLQSHLSEEYHKALNAPPPTGPGTLGEFLGGMLGSVGQWLATARLGGLPGAAAAFGSQGAYDEFLRAGMKALSEGKTIEEATAMAKASASAGGIVGTATALALPVKPALNLVQAARQGILPAVATGAGTIAQNLYERALGLQTPVTEGALTSAAMMGVLPPAAHLLGMGLRGLVPPPRVTPPAVPPPVPPEARLMPPPIPRAPAAEPALPVQPKPVVGPLVPPPPKYYDFGPKGPVEILEINNEKRTALVRPLFEPDAPTEVLKLSEIITRPARGGELDAIQKRSTETVPVGETPAGSAEMGEQVRQPEKPPDAQVEQAPAGEQPAPAERAAPLGDVAARVAELNRLAEETKKARAAEDVDALERAAIDEGTAQGLNMKVITEDLPEGGPFAGNIATRMPDGSVVINRGEFTKWIQGMKPKNRRESVSSLINEEYLHGLITDQMARDYWKYLSFIEQSLVNRRYTGRWKGMPERFTETMMGHEALRGRLQQLLRLTPREIAEARGVEWLKENIIFALERVIQNLREVLGTQASQQQRAMLDRMMENLSAAKQAVAGREAPAAYRKEKEDLLEKPLTESAGNIIKLTLEDIRGHRGRFGPDLTGLAAEIGSKARTPEDVNALKVARQEILAESHKLKQSGDIMGAISLAGRSQIADEAHIAATGVNTQGQPHTLIRFMRKYVPDYEPPMPDPAYLQSEFALKEAAAAYRKPRLEDQPEFFLPPITTAEREARPTTKELGVPAPTPRVTGMNLEASARSYLRESVKPSFDDFVSTIKEQFEEKIPPGQVKELWRDLIWPELMQMPGERLKKLVSSLRVKEEGMPSGVGMKRVWESIGKRKIPDAPAERMGLRQRAIAAIGEKLLRQAEAIPVDVARTEIKPEEIAWYHDRPGLEPSYRKITGEEAVSPRLGDILTADARVSGEPESVTKRVTALLNTDTGTVDLVSTYQTGRGVTFIVDPRAVRTDKPHVQLPVLLKQKGKQGQALYRVLDSYLLDEPVQKFRQRFDSRDEYRKQFQSTVAEEARAREMEMPVEAREVPAEEPLPSILRTGEPLTDAEAKRLYDFFAGEEITEPFQVQSSYETLLAESRPIDPTTNKPVAYTPKELAVLDSLLKLLNSEMKLRPGKDPIVAMANVLDMIYENASKEGATRQDFINALVARFPEEAVPSPSGPPTPTGRELTMRERLAPTLIRGKTLPPGEPPPDKYQRWLEEREPLQPKEGEPDALQKEETPVTPATAGEAPTRAAPAAYIKPAVKSTFEVTRDAIRGFGRLYSEWMVDRIRRAGGPITKQAADIFNRIISREHELYGGLTPTLDPARREAGKMGKATTWLHRIEPVTGRTGVANMVGAMEGTLPVPTFAQRVVDLAQQANLEIGRLYQAVVPKFVATGKAQRNPTAWGYDIIREGRGRVWDDWMAGLADANGLRPGAVRGFFRKWKRLLDDPMPDTARLERVNQDFARVFPKVVTHVKVGDIGGGRWEPVMHADLFNYLENAARRATHVRAFREYFPYDKAGRQRFQAMQNAARTELGRDYQADWDSLIRALHGHPTDNYANYGLLRPGATAGEAFHYINSTVGNLMARMVLTGQMFVQPGENIAGSTPVFLGYRNYARAAARLRQLYPEMERQGMVNRVMYDMTFDPTSPIRSLFRIGANVMSRGFMENMLNELQEAHAAATARIVTERIQAGTVSSWERRQLPLTFKAMGFTEPQVVQLMRGDVELLNQFQRKAASFLTSGNKAIAEGSRMGATRLFNSVFRFQTYPMMKLNQLRRVTGNFAEAMQKGTPQQKLAASEQLARFLFGSTLQGALTVAITAAAYEGLFGAGIRLKEARDEPLKFLAESFLATMGGPMYLVYRGSRSGGIQGFGEQALRTFFPYSIVREMTDAAQGASQYRDMDRFSRIGKFLAQRTPGTRFINMGLAVFGLSDKNLKLEASIKAFYRWRRDALGFTQQEDFLKDNTRAQFRIEMRKAVDALKAGDVEKFNAAIGRAAGQPMLKPGAVTQSLRSRRLLKTPDGKQLNPEQLAALADHIGDDSLQLLMYFDTMLDAAAESMGTVPP